MHHHAGVTAQPRVQLAVAHVHGVHAQRAALEEDVGETAGRGAQVAADQPLGIQPEALQGVLELRPAPGDVLERLPALEA